MKTNIDYLYFKDKFSSFINDLYVKNGLTLNSITDKLIESDLLDLSNEDNIQKLLEFEYEDFVYCLFKEHAKNLSNDKLAELIWSANSYLTISFNTLTPIKRVLLFCPLDRMVSLYDVYHEMNDIQLVDYFKKEIIKYNPLKALREKRGFTLHELSVLSGITTNTLKYYEKCENLSNVSVKNIDGLAKSLMVDNCIFIKEEKIAIYDLYNVAYNEKILRFMRDFLFMYYQKYIENISLLPVFEIEINNKKIYPKDIVFERAYNYAVKRYIKYEEELLF